MDCAGVGVWLWRIAGERDWGTAAGVEPYLKQVLVSVTYSSEDEVYP